MAQQWQQFLDQSGAVRDSDGTVRHFHGGGHARVAVGDHLAIIRVRGEDAEKFLQGQLSADVSVLKHGHTRLAMHLNLKGRAMASYRLLPAENGIDLVTPRSLVDANLAALKKYAAFSKVSIELDSERVPLLFIGKDGANVLRGYDIPVPAQLTEARYAAHTGVARLENGERYLLLLDYPHALRMLEQIPLNELGASDSWQLSDVLAGEAQIERGGEDQWLPQALNYDLLDGISFKKGCYLGQEIVARMHFKGSLKQRLQRLDWSGNTTLPCGQVLRDNAGKAVGEVVTCVRADHNVQALAVLRLDYQDAVYVDDVDLHAHVASLPYALPQQNG